jgi:hypothetical protein
MANTDDRLFQSSRRVRQPYDFAPSLPLFASALQITEEPRSSTPQPTTPVTASGNRAMIARRSNERRRIPCEEEFSQRHQGEHVFREYPFSGCALRELIVHTVISQARGTEDYLFGCGRTGDSQARIRGLYWWYVCKPISSHVRCTDHVFVHLNMQYRRASEETNRTTTASIVS